MLVGRARAILLHFIFVTLVSLGAQPPQQGGQEEPCHLRLYSKECLTARIPPPMTHSAFNESGAYSPMSLDVQSYHHCCIRFWLHRALSTAAQHLQSDNVLLQLAYSNNRFSALFDLNDQLKELSRIETLYEHVPKPTIRHSNSLQAAVRRVQNNLIVRRSLVLVLSDSTAYLDPLRKGGKHQFRGTRTKLLFELQRLLQQDAVLRVFIAGVRHDTRTGRGLLGHIAQADSKDHWRWQQASRISRSGAVSAAGTPDTQRNSQLRFLPYGVRQQFDLSLPGKGSMTQRNKLLTCYLVVDTWNTAYRRCVRSLGPSLCAKCQRLSTTAKYGALPELSSEYYESLRTSKFVAVFSSAKFPSRGVKESRRGAFSATSTGFVGEEQMDSADEVGCEGWGASSSAWINEAVLAGSVPIVESSCIGIHNFIRSNNKNSGAPVLLPGTKVRIGDNLVGRYLPILTIQSFSAVGGAAKDSNTSLQQSIAVPAPLVDMVNSNRSSTIAVSQNAFFFPLAPLSAAKMSLLYSLMISDFGQQLFTAAPFFSNYWLHEVVPFDELQHLVSRGFSKHDKFVTEYLPRIIEDMKRTPKRILKTMVTASTSRPSASGAEAMKIKSTREAVKMVCSSRVRLSQHSRNSNGNNETNSKIAGCDSVPQIEIVIPRCCETAQGDLQWVDQLLLHSSEMKFASNASTEDRPALGITIYYKCPWCLPSKKAQNWVNSIIRPILTAENDTFQNVQSMLQRHGGIQVLEEFQGRAAAETSRGRQAVQIHEFPAFDIRVNAKEVTAYLEHITSRYDCLAAHTLFLHAQPAHHLEFERFSRLFRYLLVCSTSALSSMERDKAIDGLQILDSIDFLSVNYRHFSGAWAHQPEKCVMDVMQHMFGTSDAVDDKKRLPPASRSINDFKKMEMGGGVAAQFVVSREAVRQRSLSWWRKLQALNNGSTSDLAAPECKARDFKEGTEVASAMERLWHNFFRDPRRFNVDSTSSDPLAHGNPLYCPDVKDITWLPQYLSEVHSTQQLQRQADEVMKLVALALGRQPHPASNNTVVHNHMSYMITKARAMAGAAATGQSPKLWTAKGQEIKKRADQIRGRTNSPVGVRIKRPTARVGQ